MRRPPLGRTVLCRVLRVFVSSCPHRRRRSGSSRSCRTSPRSCSRSARDRRLSPSAPTTSSRPKCDRCRPSARWSIPTPSASSRCGPISSITYGSQADLQAQLKTRLDSLLRLSPRRPRSHHGDDARAWGADRTRRSGREGGARGLQAGDRCGEELASPASRGRARCWCSAASPARSATSTPAPAAASSTTCSSSPAARTC